MPFDSLRIGLPTYRHIMPETVGSLWQLQGFAKLDIVRNTEVARARNDIASRLEEDVLLFVDDDVDFDPKVVESLLHALESKPRRGAVSALYITWTGSGRPVCGWLDDKEWLSHEDTLKRTRRYMKDKAIVEVDKFGAGLLAIRKEVFEQVPPPWFSAEVDPEIGMISEDIYFCRKMKKAGFQPSVHFGAHAGHLGPTLWHPEMLLA